MLRPLECACAGLNHTLPHHWRASRNCVHAQYVLIAYLTVFTVGVLLGMAFSPATPEELQWLAERSARLRATRELPPQASLQLVHAHCRAC